jgi:hypothetical protein
MGGIGVLDVIADGHTVFSAKATGRMPTTGEILEALAVYQH